MNATVKEWVAKAEANYATAARELAVTESQNMDAVCFHSQQCIEKLMKAVLISSGETPPKIHDLVQLAAMITGIRPTWTWPAEELRLLSLGAVGYRNPGEAARPEEARESFDAATRLRASLTSVLT